MSHVLIDRLIDELGYQRITQENHEEFVAQPGMNVLFFPGDPTTVKDATDVHDFHATLLHMLGFDHERLTYRYAGRDFRLTDVHGTVVKDILA